MSRISFSTVLICELDSCILPKWPCYNSLIILPKKIAFKLKNSTLLFKLKKYFLFISIPIEKSFMYSMALSKYYDTRSVVIIKH